MNQTKKAAPATGQPTPDKDSITSILSQGSIENIRNFFEELYGTSAPGYISIFAKERLATPIQKGNGEPETHQSRSWWFSSQDLSKLADFINRLSRQKNMEHIYFGIGLQNKMRGESVQGSDFVGIKKRGTNDNAIALPGLWLDLDCSEGVHKANEDPTKQLPTFKDARELLKELPLQPTMIINSGGGLYPIWLFNTLWVFNNDEERKKAAQLVKRFETVIMAWLNHKYGYHLDGTSDLARLLRIPGTLNRKREPAPCVEIAEQNQGRYDVQQFERMITVIEGQLPEPVRLPELPGIRTSTDSDYPNTDAEMIANKCAFIRHCRDNAATLTEPDWYSMLTVIARTKDGIEKAHEWSSPYPGYSFEETEKKIQHALNDSGPMTCSTIKSNLCEGCKFKGKIKSPIVLGMDRVGEARETVKEALKQIGNGETKVAFESPTIGALALLERESPDDFDQFKKELKKNKVSITELRQVMKRENTKAKIRLVEPGEHVARLAGDMLQNCPIPELIIPDSYVVTENKVMKYVTKKETVIPVEVALAPVLITGLFRDMRYSTESFRVSWKRLGRWEHETIDREIAASARHIVSLAAKGFPVTSVSAGELTTYLAKFEAENMNRLPIAQTSSQLGWQGKDGEAGFLWGRTFIRNNGEEINGMNLEELEPGELHEDIVGFRGLDAGDEQLADGFHRRGTLEEWLGAMKIASNYPKVLLGFYTAFVPPLLQILHCDNFILEYARRSSTGKSVTQRIAASVMGNPDEHTPDSVMRMWDSTNVGVEKMSSLFNSLPLILDDTKKAKDYSFVAKTIYQVTSGIEKSRGTLKGLGVSRAWRTVLISSGEMKSTAFTDKDGGSNGGTKGRVLAVTSLPFDGDGPEVRRVVEELSLHVTMNYGHAYPIYLKWIMSKRDQWGEWEKIFRQQVNFYAGRVNGAIEGRLAKYAAAIDIAASLVHAAFKDYGSPLPWDHVDPFPGRLWDEIAREAEDATGEEQAMREVIGWAFQHQTSFMGRHKVDYEGKAIQPPSGWIGKWETGDDWKYISFYTDRLKRFLAENNYNPKEVFTHWKERGWLDVPPSSRGFQKDLRVDGVKQWFVVLKREAVDSIE